MAVCDKKQAVWRQAVGDEVVLGSRVVWQTWGVLQRLLLLLHGEEWYRESKVWVVLHELNDTACFDSTHHPEK